jgi:hypothetical protein
MLFTFKSFLFDILQDKQHIETYRPVSSNRSNDRSIMLPSQWKYIAQKTEGEKKEDNTRSIIKVFCCQILT